jgi:hypothetical protein
MRLDVKNFRVSTHVWQKREFNPTNKEDLQEYQYFLNNGKWKQGCPFIVEWPFLNVIDAIKQKIINRHLAQIISAAKETA